MSCQQSMKFIQLINVKMPTIVGILTFINMTSFSFHKKVCLILLNNIYRYTLPSAHFLGHQDVETKYLFFADLILYVPSTIFQL